MSSWEILRLEALGSNLPPTYAQQAAAELEERGFAPEEMREMRRLIWNTAGWLGHEMGHPAEVEPDDIRRALRDQLCRGSITAEDKQAAHDLLEKFLRT